jgi:hypothetical protein
MSGRRESRAPKGLLAHQMLVERLRRAFESARWLLEDVGEEDCFWEPSAPCWSVRRRAEASRAWGTGEWVCEDAWPSPDPLPNTSIAWRLAHPGAWTDVYRSWTFEGGHLDLGQLEVPGSCEGLVAWVHSAQDRFLAHVESMDEAALTDLRPAHFGVDLPAHHLVGIIADEHVHHGAEIGLLRDLRRGHARMRPPG